MIESFYAFLYLYAMMPAQVMQFRHIGELAHGSIGFRSVETELAGISHRLHNQLGNSAD